MDEFVKWVRPGFFGRRKDEKIAELNARHGAGNWELFWIVPEDVDRKPYTFKEACRFLYEESYYWWLHDHPEAVEHITSFGECYDNEVNNIESGLDYTIQKSYSTHIQDIAVRNCLRRLGVWFKGPADKLLQIRGTGEGEQYNPGHIPFHSPQWITQPSLRPKWAAEGSVEDFWQSNKWVCIRPPDTTGIR